MKAIKATLSQCSVILENRGELLYISQGPVFFHLCHSSYFPHLLQASAPGEVIEM